MTGVSCRRPLDARDRPLVAGALGRPRGRPRGTALEFGLRDVNRSPHYYLPLEQASADTGFGGRLGCGRTLAVRTRGNPEGTPASTNVKTNAMTEETRGAACTKAHTRNGRRPARKHGRARRQANRKPERNGPGTDDALNARIISAPVAEEPRPDRRDVLPEPRRETDPPQGFLERVEPVAGQPLQLVRGQNRLAHDAGSDPVEHRAERKRQPDDAGRPPVSETRNSTNSPNSIRSGPAASDTNVRVEPTASTTARA